MKARLSHVSFPRRRPGQALVELALTITFVAFLLSAAIDLGLAYKTHQMLINATAEASTYLSEQPLLPCNGGCTIDALKAGADAQARANFRAEAGPTLKLNGLPQLLDLNSNGVDDVAEGLDFQGGGWISIDAADATQFDPTNPDAFDIHTFTPSTLSACTIRDRQYLSGQCYIVVRAKAIYRPYFAFAPFIGSQMTITAYAIKPIVAGS